MFWILVIIKEHLNIIRITKSRWVRKTGHAARMAGMRNAYKTLVGRPQRKRPLRRPAPRWYENIKMDLK
jgi:hypothetical protein